MWSFPIVTALLEESHVKTLQFPPALQLGHVCTQIPFFAYAPSTRNSGSSSRRSACSAIKAWGKAVSYCVRLGNCFAFHRVAPVALLWFSSLCCRAMRVCWRLDFNTVKPVLEIPKSGIGSQPCFKGLWNLFSSLQNFTDHYLFRILASMWLLLKDFHHATG